MSHQIYHTEGFILARRDLKEADNLLFVLTDRFGLLPVYGRGLRLLSSKLRYHTTSFNHINLSLVRGREFWRLIAVSDAGLSAKLETDREKWRIYTNVLLLLKRFFQGEEDSRQFFEDLKQGLSLLAASDSGSIDYQDLECVLVLRILRHLGYLADEPALRPFLDFTDWTPELVGQISDRRSQALSLINRSFRSAGL